MANRVAVLGCGSWGTALAAHLLRLGHGVTLWGNESSVVDELRSSKRNSKYFPGEEIPIPTPFNATISLSEALSGCDAVVLAVPSFAIRSVCQSIREHLSPTTIVISAAKGLEEGTNQFLGEVISRELGSDANVAVLSGPSFALEVLRGLPCAVTIAAYRPETALAAANLVHSPSFRAYTSDDVIGVEVGGAVKNVIALAVGMIDGLGMGANARAALITRGLTEIKRLVVTLGGNSLTPSGLSGLGDLLLTATGDLSRNRRVGLRLGAGEPLDKILQEIGQVAEGVVAAPKIFALAQRLKIDMPICEEVNRVVSGESTVPESVRSLLSRAPTAEFDF